MAYIASIRQRGQITIPGKIRSNLPWLDEGSAIHIVVNDQSITISPYQKATAEKTNWKKIWQMIKLTRSFKSKGPDLPASQFIINDRLKH